jgi:hypothetical protein
MKIRGWRQDQARFSLCKAAGQNARSMHIVIQREQVNHYE